MARMPGGDLEQVRRKVLAGLRLDEQDGLAICATRDVHGLGELASVVRRRLHGTNVYYNINRHIHYTNYCVLACSFCSFCRPWPPAAGRPADGSAGGDPSGGYERSVEEIVALARQAADDGAGEVHIVGGLHPRLPFEYYLDVCRGIRAACPGLHIKAFTAVEIVHFARISRPRRTVRQVLEALREAGLDSLPGGGAEIFDQRVHDEAFKAKIGEQDWFAVHRQAHDLGIFSNATMLYGHIEAPAERVAHLLKIRAHQDESLARGGARFNCLVPLPFIPEGSRLAHLPGPTGLDDLRTIALTRLLVDNVPHVKAFWVMLSPKMAQVALHWGADDLDGTVVHYDITRRELRGGDEGRMSAGRLRRLIRQAGFTPVERDSLYAPVNRSDRSP